MGRLAFGLALPAHGFLFHDGHSGSIHLRIQHRDRFSHNNRQIQLHGPLDFCLLARGDIFPDSLRRALHGLGGHLQIGQKFQLLASLIEGVFLADDRLHAAHTGRELRVGDIQFDISRELTGMALRTQVVRT